MEKIDLLKYKGKNVFVIMKNSYHYQGYCMDVTETSLKMRDEFGQDLDIDIASVSSVLQKKKKWQ